MKKWALALIASAALAAGARADSGWGMFGTYWSPGDWDETFGVGSKISFEMAPHALFDVRATWLDDLTLSDRGAELTVETVPVDVGVTVAAGLDPVDIYFSGGLSWYPLDGDLRLADGATVDAGLDDEVGFYGGVGLEWTIARDPADVGATRITLFAEALYRHVSVSDVSAGAGAFEVDDLSGFAANAGVMVRW